MNEFVTVLHGRVAGALDALTAAREAGHDYEADLQVAQVRELLELAGRHDVDTAGWVEPALLRTRPCQD